MEIRQPAVIEAPAGQGASAGLLLKTTPPRIQRDLLTRQRLLLGTGRFREVPAILVQAPAGFGKTSLLAQWRRECLGEGSIVLWLTASPLDDPSRLLRGLVESFRASACRPTFGHALLASQRMDPLEGLTPREREVLGLMAEGRSNQGIADRLVITERAVEKHVTSIFGKLRLPAASADHRRVLAVLTFLRS